MRPARRLFLACTAIVATAAPLLASTFLPVDLPGLTRISETVVLARVAETESRWNDDHSMIFTRVRIEIMGTLWGGEALASIDLRLPGGTVDGFTAEMAGAPTLRAGEDVVLFLGRWDDGVAMIAGYNDGVARVIPDATGNLTLKGGVADGMPLAALSETLGRIAR